MKPSAGGWYDPIEPILVVITATADCRPLPAKRVLGDIRVDKIHTHGDRSFGGVNPEGNGGRPIQIGIACGQLGPKAETGINCNNTARSSSLSCSSIY
jgi:hypothetical protein